MAQITPSELSEREFTKSIRGYNTVEVDEYINKIVENYAKLYRENIILSQRLAEAEEKLSDANEEKDTIKKTLETARKTGDAIIKEAYEKADVIYASVKTGCDAILHSFRDKIEAQKKALSDIQQTVYTFKNELFEKYRLHIELIEQMSPIYEYKENLSPEEYVSHVVSDMKKEVAAQYGISLDTISKPNPSKAEKSAYKETPTVEMTKMTGEFSGVFEAAKEMALRNSDKKKKDSIPSIVSLLDEQGEANGAADAVKYKQ